MDKKTQKEKETLKEFELEIQIFTLKFRIKKVFK
ncbi:hypothetical protein PSHO110982_00980 [Pseudostreptobacillus hongkongensis]